MGLLHIYRIKTTTQKAYDTSMYTAGNHTFNATRRQTCQLQVGQYDYTDSQSILLGWEGESTTVSFEISRYLFIDSRMITLIDMIKVGHIV